MPGPVLVQNMHIVSGQVNYGQDGVTVVSTTLTLRPDPGGTLIEGTLQIAMPGLVGFALGSEYQLVLNTP